MLRPVFVAACLLASAAFATAQPEIKKPPLPAAITSDMVLPSEGVKSSSAPNDIRIYVKGRDGKVNRLQQPKDKGYPKFPKSDVKLEEGEVPQFHQGRDFPTSSPTSFMAGVHGTVIYAKDSRVLVLMPTGQVMHYLHASEVGVKFGDVVTPKTALGKTSDHLHLQATDKDNRLIDVDKAFLDGRSPIRGSTIKAFEPKWVDAGPIYVDEKNKKLKIVNGVLKVDESKRVYYDDDAPAVSSLQKELEGTQWYGYGELNGGSYRIDLWLETGGKFRSVETNDKKKYAGNWGVDDKEIVAIMYGEGNIANLKKVNGKLVGEYPIKEGFYKGKTFTWTLQQQK